ncbi:TIGR04219 family outer membrane beta-barrel protein [Colwellia ponticola]|uniref:TIGR04219 family outer membrane beta-barrel protein n=1 Tax=Colwellia ponticola TaxID=2304625 RepID=A0A8H2JLR0_9GAMM|nr:TIGR04219 family outer membrane beta-barrel protein [Colwellia ponticola]TMM43725.1 hypothetical protein FCS21_12350 [Colwellia ponticola]
MKKIVFSVMLMAFFTANVQAAFTFTPQENNKVGLYLGGQIWQSEVSGFFGKKNTLSGFNLKKTQQSNYFIGVKHPFSMLPNLRISSTRLDNVGKTNSTQRFSIDNDSTVIYNNVDTDVDISYVDYTLYYPLFDNGLFSFDLGLTARDFDGAVTETDTTTTVMTSHDGGLDAEEHPEHGHIVTETTTTIATDKIKTNDIEPMLYVATNINLPLRGLSVFGQGDFLLIADHSLYDYQVGLSYDLVDSSVVAFNVTLGYRILKMEFEDVDNLYTELEFKGVFFGVMTHF